MDTYSYDVVSLNYQRQETGKKLKNIASASIEHKCDKLHIAGEVITIHQALVSENVGNQELDYVRDVFNDGENGFAFIELLSRRNLIRTAIKDLVIDRLITVTDGVYRNQGKR